MNVLVKQSILYHLHHAVYSMMKNQYHIQTEAAAAAEGPNGKLTSTDLLGLVTLIVTTLLPKQIPKSVEPSILAA